MLHSDANKFTGSQIKAVMFGDRAGAPATNCLFDVFPMVAAELAENFVIFILTGEGIATAGAAVRNATTVRDNAILGRRRGT